MNLQVDIMENDEKMPLSRAFLWILVSVLLVSGSSLMGWLYYQHIREMKFQDDQYRIQAIIQEASHSDSLKTVYLAELLNLSLDRPVNLYQFKIKEALEVLKNTFLIRDATIKKILPGTLYINYQMRKPIAYIGDYSNTAIDEEGILFPFRPFFTPKQIPVIYLGIENDNYQWGSSLKKLISWKLVLSLLKHLDELQLENFFLKQVDVSRAYSDSYGQRQMVILLDHRRSTFSFLLRLNSEIYVQNLINFRTLFQSHFEKLSDSKNHSLANVTIDFRSPHLAFISTHQ